MVWPFPAGFAQGVAGFAGTAIAGLARAGVRHGIGLALPESPCRDHRLGGGVGHRSVDFLRSTAMIAKIVFADPCEGGILNRLLHPLVQRLRLERIEMGGHATGDDQAAQRKPVIARHLPRPVDPAGGNIAAIDGDGWALGTSPRD